MAGELNNEDTVSLREMSHRANEFALNSLPTNQRYQAHKERMAHTALLLQVAIFGWIMAAEEWPFSWISNLSIELPPKLIAFTGIFIIWVGIHIYVRWQLRRRRSSAFFEQAVRITLTKWLTKSPRKDDLEFQSKKENSKFKIFLDCLFVFLDYLFVHSKAPVILANDKEIYPKAIYSKWEKEAKKGTGALWPERLICYGSYLMFLMIFVRTWFGDSP